MNDDTSDGAAPGDAERMTPLEALASLLDDLTTLDEYLEERSHHTYELAQRFLANARRDSGSRAFDERQATMLEYQHYIWAEITSRLSKLIDNYQPYAHPAPDTSTAEDPSGSADAQHDGSA